MSNPTSGSDRVQLKNILLDHEGKRDFKWVSRAIDFVKANSKNVNVKPAWISKKAIERTLQNVNDTFPPSVLLEIISEISYSNKLFIIRWLGYALVKILRSNLSGLHINSEKLIQIKSTLRDAPVIFVPSHRSYCDFILMAFICFHFDIQLPCVAAGMDFHGMWVMGRVIRACKAFFIRRTFGSDKLYKTAFEAYVNSLLVYGDSPLQFFIEGTRSRTAKALTPKFGLLTMALETFFAGSVPDITIVPVNLSYERILEEELFAFELLGVPKPKESTFGLFKALNILDKNYGNFFTTFGDPISLRKFLDGKFDFSVRNKAQEIEHITSLGYHIVNEQQKHTTLTCSNLVALILSCSVVEQDEFPSLKELCRRVESLSVVLSSLGAHIFNECKEGEVHANVVRCIENLSFLNVNDKEVIQIVEKLYDPTKLQGSVVKDLNMSQTVPFIMLQLYANPCYYFLVRPAIVCSLLTASKGKEIFNKDELFQNYCSLCRIFSVEFVLHESWLEKDYAAALIQLDELKVIRNGTDAVHVNSNNETLLLLSHALHPFIHGFLIAMKTILKFELTEISESALREAFQTEGAEWLRSKAIRNPYALSLSTFSNALATLLGLKWLDKNSEKKTILVTDRSQIADQYEGLIQLLQPIPESLLRSLLYKSKL